MAMMLLKEEEEGHTVSVIDPLFTLMPVGFL